MQNLLNIKFEDVNNIKITNKDDLYEALRRKYYQYANLKDICDLKELQIDKITINVGTNDTPISTIDEFINDRLSGRIKDKYTSDILKSVSKKFSQNCQELYDKYCKENTKTFDYKKLKVKSCRGATYIIKDEESDCMGSIVSHSTHSVNYDAWIVFYNDRAYYSAYDVSYQYNRYYNSIVLSIGDFNRDFDTSYKLVTDRPYVEFVEE